MRFPGFFYQQNPSAQHWTVLKLDRDGGFQIIVSMSLYCEWFVSHPQERELSIRPQIDHFGYCFPFMSNAFHAINAQVCQAKGNESLKPFNVKLF